MVIRNYVSYKYQLSIFTLNTGRSSKGIAVEDTGIITGLASPRFSSTSYNVGPQKTIPILWKLFHKYHHLITIFKAVIFHNYRVFF